MHVQGRKRSITNHVPKLTPSLRALVSPRTEARGGQVGGRGGGKVGGAHEEAAPHPPSQAYLCSEGSSSPAP